MFQFFANFGVAKLKPFFGKARQSFADHLNSKLVIGTFLENDFEATFKSKTNILNIWTGKFLIYCKFLIGEVETIFWESEAKWGKLFKSWFGHRKLLKKSFWGYFKLKNECSERLKRACFSFLQVFDWRSWNRFLGKRGKVRQTI